MKTYPLLAPAALGLALLPAAALGQETVQMERFEVTAQKRLQTIGEVPVPLTAYTGAFLDQAGVTSYQELAPLVPGLFVQEQSPNNPGINLRGITTDSGDPRAESRVSIFQDGVSIGRSRGSVVELFDLERIEVLKGPQGTLFGRGAEIGAISIVQAKARDERSGSLTLGLGSDGARRASGHVNAPLAEGRLFGRIAWTYDSFDGTRSNLADGSELNGKETLAFRASLRWQPSDATTVDLIANFQRDEPPGTGFKSGVIPTSGGDTNPFAAAQLNRGAALGLERTVDGITGIVTHELSPAWTLTAITGWREFDAYEEFDADGSRLYLLEFAEDARSRQFSQEIRLNFDAGGRFAGFVGAGWFDEDGSTRVPFRTDERQLWPFLSGSFRSGLLAGGVPAPLVNFAAPALHPFVPQAALPATFAAFANPALPASLQQLAFLAGAPLQPHRADEYTQFGATRAFDLFADGTWKIADRLELTAGLRYTRESIHSGYQASNGSPPTLGFIVNSIPGYPYLPTNGRRSARDNTSAWDGRLVGRYEFSPTLSAYAGVARGHRPASLLLDSTTTTALQEETVFNYEAGLKGTLASGGIQWAASAYRYEYEHFQSPVLSLGRFTLLDAGSATGEGFEFSLQGRASDTVSVFATYAFTDATFDAVDDQGRPQQYAGYTFRLTPRHAYSLGGTATFAGPWGSRFLVTPVWSYKSPHFFEDNNASFNGGLRQKAFHVVNLRLGWRSPRARWEVTAHADNVLDEDYLIDAGNVGASFGIPTFVAGSPRRYGVDVTFRW